MEVLSGRETFVFCGLQSVDGSSGDFSLSAANASKESSHPVSCSRSPLDGVKGLDVRWPIGFLSSEGIGGSGRRLTLTASCTPVGPVVQGLFWGGAGAGLVGPEEGGVVREGRGAELER